jgi:hypothetical protein
MPLGVRKCGAVSSSSSCVKEVWISCRYLRGRGSFIGGPGVP